MALFGKQHFKSPNESAEMAYKLGVLAVSAKEYQAAYEFFNKAAEAERGSGGGVSKSCWRGGLKRAAA